MSCDAAKHADDATVVHDTSEIARARRMARATAASALPADRLDDVVLVVSELVTNALQYGTGEPVDVRVRSSASGIDVSVSSPSLGHLDPAPQPASVDAVRGRGLFIVDALSDEVIIDDREGSVVITSRFVAE